VPVGDARPIQLDNQGMGLNREIATELAESRLAEWRALGYADWTLLLDNSDLRHVVARDGRRYSVRSTALNDGDGRVRMSVAVDDGGWSSLRPLVHDDIMSPDGTFAA
jgi:hypothetical protein